MATAATKDDDKQQQPNKRLILAVRHGESEFNVLHAANPSDPNIYTLQMVDCNITKVGQEQAQQAGVVLSQQLQGRPPDVILTSPLRRCLQTTLGILKSMPATTDIEVCPQASEIMEAPCDIGSTPDALAKEFPQWDFSKLSPNCWWPHGQSPEETLQQMMQTRNNNPKQMQATETEAEATARMQELKQLLRQRSEQVIVLVCHSDVIWHLTSTIKEGERFGTWSKNGQVVDISSFVLEG